VVKLHDLIHLVIKPQDHSLKLQSLRAATWSILEKGCSHAIRLIGSLILTRILFPEAFGIMAASNIVIVMVQLFTDVGIKAAIVQNPNGAKEDFLNTSWIICTLRGVILSILIIALAWPISLYYDQPEIKWILFILALSPLFLGFENPALTVLIKRFRVEKKVALELVSQALGLTTMIILAYLMQSVYALAIGTSLSSLYRVVGSFIIVQYRPRMHFNRTYALEIFHFGKFIFINTLISFTAMNVDVFMIGKILPMKDLGFYSIGKNIGQLIWIVCMQVFVQSYMPAVSSVYNDIKRVTRMYKRTAAFILAFTIPSSVVFALFSGDIIHILYDPRYQDASISMLWFCLGGIFLVFNAINSNTFIAMGKPFYETECMAVGTVFIFTLVPLWTISYGIKGAAEGMAVSVVIIALCQSINLRRAFRFPLAVLVRPWLQISAVMALIYCMYRLSYPALSSTRLNNIPFMLLMSLIALVISALLYILFEGTHPFRDQMHIKTEA